MDTLEIIKKGEIEKKPKAILSGESKKSGEKGGNPKKDIKRSVSFRDESIPKKVCTENFYDLCKKHGGAHTTHNTGECRKSNKG